MVPKSALSKLIRYLPDILPSSIDELTFAPKLDIFEYISEVAIDLSSVTFLSSSFNCVSAVKSGSLASSNKRASKLVACSDSAVTLAVFAILFSVVLVDKSTSDVEFSNSEITA